MGSRLELLDATVEDLDPDRDQTYHTIASHYGYDPMGVPETKEDDALFEQYRNGGALGTLSERKWEEGIRWKMPDADSTNSFWVSNASNEDKSVAPTFLCRNLAMLRLQMENQGLCSTKALRQEYAERTKVNDEIVDLLHGHWKLWIEVRGPEFESMRRPSESTLKKAHETKDQLQRMREAYQGSADGTAIFCEEMIQAIDKLKSLDFEVIRREKFKQTPEAIFSEFVKGMGHAVEREKAEEKRRLAMLNEDVGVANDDVGDAVPNLRPCGEDKFGCDPDGFHDNRGNKPRNWVTAMRVVEVVHIDEMREPLLMRF